MGDSNNNPKTNVPSSIQCPMLSTTNYSVWAMRMNVTLRIHDVWEAIDPGCTDSKKNDVATALLFQSIPEALILQVGEQDSPKKIWELLRTRNLLADRVREARLQTLMSEFDRLKMKETESIDSFAAKLSEITSKSASLGKVMDEPQVVKKFLKSLPRKKYIQITASLEQVLDLNKTGFEDIVGRLKAYEERLAEEDNPEETQENHMCFQLPWTGLLKEIVSSTVQRSVSTATQTTKELVLKDYAMESHESRIHSAAHLMVASLSGSLAHVTCKVVSLSATVVGHLITWETMQMTTSNGQQCSMAYYLEKTYYKTASLIANSCKAIALLAGQTTEVSMLPYEYWKNQVASLLHDDFLDNADTRSGIGSLNFVMGNK